MPTPTVSVIVPLYNAEDTLATCLDSLIKQDYTNIKEIIVVDNGSTDNSRAIADQYPIKVYSYTDIQGSYAARNFGLEKANSKLIAFTDADCDPSQDWITQLVSCFCSTDADLVGGNVKFQFANGSAAEIHDATTSMNNKRLIESRNCSVTANILIKKSVFNDIGLFPANLKSGGDVQWTHYAVENGYKIRYCPFAVVFHPTRNLLESFKKYYRLGYGEGQKIREKKISYQLKRLLISILPRPISYIKRDLEHNGINDDSFLVFKLFFIGWACRIVQAYGKIRGLK